MQTKVTDALRKRDLIEIVTDAEGLLLGHRISAAGLEAIGCLPDDADTDAADEPDAMDAPSAAPRLRTGARKPRTRGKAAQAALRATDGAKDGAQRPNTKQAALVAMLRRADGASIEEIAAAFSWQNHTVRGTISGALKRKLGLDVRSERVDGRRTVYSLPVEG